MKATQKIVALLLCVGIAVAFVRPAIAAPSLAVNVGMLDVLTLPSHSQLGLYPYAGLSLAVSSGAFTALPMLGIEWSPDGGTWGFTATCTVDYGLLEWLGLDVNFALIHDQVGAAWKDAAFLAGVGPGVSLIAPPWTVSLFASAYRLLGGEDWFWSPGINVAWSLPTPQ